MKLKERKVTIPELILIGSTRVALGLGIGFADKRQAQQRSAPGGGVGPADCRRSHDDSVGNRSVEQEGLSSDRDTER